MSKTTLQYKFPNRQAEVDAIKRMPPDRVQKLRDEVVARLEQLVASCDDYFENLIESHCYICSKYGYAYFGLPDKWGWLDDGTLMCDDCQERWARRFGDKPNVSRGGANEDVGIS